MGRGRREDVVIKSESKVKGRETVPMAGENVYNMGKNKSNNWGNDNDNQTKKANNWGNDTDKHTKKANNWGNDTDSGSGDGWGQN